MDDFVLIYFLILAFVVVCFLTCWYFFIRKHEVKTKNSVVGRNHDHLKKPHKSKESALTEIQRMHNNGITGSDRMNAYYNRERKAWFIGKSSL